MAIDREQAQHVYRLVLVALLIALALAGYFIVKVTVAILRRGDGALEELRGRRERQTNSGLTTRQV